MTDLSTEEVMRLLTCALSRFGNQAEFERRLLGEIMNGRAEFSKAADIRLFADTRHQEIFISMYSLWASAQPITIESTAQVLIDRNLLGWVGGLRFLEDLTRLPLITRGSTDFMHLMKRPPRPPLTKGEIEEIEVALQTMNEMDIQ